MTLDGLLDVLAVGQVDGRASTTSSVPQGPSRSVAVPPIRAISAGDLAADVVPDVAVAGGGERAQLGGAVLAGQHRPRRPAPVASSTCSCSSRLLAGVTSRLPRSIAARRRPRSMVDLGGVPGPVRARSRPARRPRRRARPRRPGPSTSAFLRRNISAPPRCVGAAARRNRRWNRTRPSPRAEPGRSLDLDEPRLLDPLDHQLGDPVARGAASTGVVRVEVDQQHLDLAAVAGVDGARARSRSTARAGRPAPSAGAPARRTRRAGRSRCRSAPAPAPPARGRRRRW